MRLQVSSLPFHGVFYSSIDPNFRGFSIRMTYKLLKGFKSQTLQDVYRAIRYFHDDLRLIFFLLSLTASQPFSDCCRPGR